MLLQQQHRWSVCQKKNISSLRARRKVQVALSSDSATAPYGSAHSWLRPKWQRVLYQQLQHAELQSSCSLWLKSEAKNDCVTARRDSSTKTNSSLSTRRLRFESSESGRDRLSPYCYCERTRAYIITSYLLLLHLCYPGIPARQ